MDIDISDTIEALVRKVPVVLQEPVQAVAHSRMGVTMCVCAIHLRL